MSRASKGNKRILLTLRGRVQGVGFRPAVYRLAAELTLAGTVSNTTAGALIDIEGPGKSVDTFVRLLPKRLPPHGRIDSLKTTTREPSGASSFVIEKSRTRNAPDAELPPDLALCDPCKAELFNPSDRRYRYPFINCTDCGPRFSIIKGIPYDRPKTTMAGFTLCPDCAREYHDPLNRRFHAQPDACPACGPHISLTRSDGCVISSGDHAIKQCAALIKQGKICAVKGIGGYHLVCDATNAAALRRLRARKIRPSKPFALMARDIKTAASWCIVSEAERASLLSSARPIVLLQKNTSCAILDILAPGNRYLGVMLPYAPVHELLFTDGDFSFLVMTSGNRADEPIAIDDTDALRTLSGIADAFLTHNRPIHNRCDDSIIQHLTQPEPEISVIRRSRGYVPDPVTLPASKNMPVIFAAGAELKNTFTLTRGSKAYVSAYIGDLDTEAALAYYRESLTRMNGFLSVQPAAIACDLHPDYASTRFARDYARKNSLPIVAVQHHHAHVASVIAEHGLSGPLIGIAFDGTGLGTDSTIWGGECFIVRNAQFSRFGYLERFPLPGGDAATRETWRLALAAAAFCGIAPRLPQRYPVETVRRMISSSINSPLCSSAGRVFDTVAALIGLRFECDHEAQAAMELEALASAAPGAANMDFTGKKVYNFTVRPGGAASDARQKTGIMISLQDAYRQINAAAAAGTSLRSISLTFHRTMAEIIVAMSLNARAAGGGSAVCLSGGVFQNRLLLAMARHRLTKHGFTVYINTVVPSNDGGISLGQAWCATRGYRIQ